MISKIYLLFVILIIAVIGEQNKSSFSPVKQREMLKIIVLYPNETCKVFDMDGDIIKQVPALEYLFQDVIAYKAVDKDWSVRTHESKTIYQALGHCIAGALKRCLVYVKKVPVINQDFLKSISQQSYLASFLQCRL